VAWFSEPPDYDRFDQLFECDDDVEEFQSDVRNCLDRASTLGEARDCWQR
jgi:hypothetical protein